MEHKDYLEAVKKITVLKPKENFMVIELYYDNKLVLPYKDGITFLSAMSNAEYLKESYSEPHRISGITRDVFKTTVMSSEDYNRYKIAALLNITIDELKEHEKLVA